MENKNFWDEFYTTGTVESYIKYKEHTRARRSLREDTPVEAHHGRSGHRPVKPAGK